MDQASQFRKQFSTSPDIEGFVANLCQQFEQHIVWNPLGCRKQVWFSIFSNIFKAPTQDVLQAGLGNANFKEKHRGSCFSPPLSGTKLSEEGLRGGVSTLSPCRMDAHWAMLPWPAPQT